MKHLRWMVVFLVLGAFAGAQNGRVPEEKQKLFSVRDMFWGYGQFDVAPPHNEPDPNLCAATAKDDGGKDAPCNAFARYLISGYVEVRPFARTQLRRLMFFGAPTFVFGKNVPQALYTWSFDGIGWERSWGAGIEIGHGFQARVTQHFLFQRFGVRDRYLGQADLGPNGPWGRYTVIGVRKYFGHHPAE
jgi:hypothetical protein